MKKKIMTALTAGITASMIASVPVMAYEKEETVYTKTDKDGNVTYQVVSEHLSSSKKETINDYSDLENIKNISGDEKYIKNGENISWSSKGEDIFYQGKLSKQLPLKIKTTYKLNGKEVKPSDVDGQKGKVEITFDYINNEVHDYKGQKIYTPFVVVLASTLPSDTNKNITVTNGKVVNNGKNNVIIGLAAPGLYESFNKREKLKDLNHITISFDTTDFSLKSFYMAATPKLLESKDINKVLDKIDGSFNSIDDLKKATDQLVLGSNELTKGTSQLKEGTKVLDNATKNLNNGTQVYYSKIKEASSGASKISGNSEQLRKGSYALVDGLKQFYGNKDNLNQLLDAVKRLSTGANDLNNAVNSNSSTTLSDGTKQLLDQVKDSAYQSAAYGIKASVSKKIAGSLSQEALNKQSAAIKEMAEATSELTKLETLSGLIKELQKKSQQIQKSIDEGQQKIDAAMKQKKALESQISVEQDASKKAALQKTLDTVNAGINAGTQAIEAAKSSLTAVITTIKTLQSSSANPTASSLSAAKTRFDNAQKALKALQDATKDAPKASAILSMDDTKLASMVKNYYENYYLKGKSVPESVDGGIYKGLQDAKAFDTITKTFGLLNNYQGNIDKISQGIKQLAQGTSQLQNAVNSSIPKLTGGIAALFNGSVSLDKGIRQYTQGVDTLADGIGQLASAFLQITNGTAKLSNASTQLSKGADRLDQGAKKLSRGISQYKSQGIDKLTQSLDDLKNDSNKVKQLVQYGKDYQYTKTNKDAQYETKFIYIIQE